MERMRKDLLSQQQLYPVGQGRKPEAVASRPALNAARSKTVIISDDESDDGEKASADASDTDSDIQVLDKLPEPRRLPSNPPVPPLKDRTPVPIPIPTNVKIPLPRAQAPPQRLSSNNNQEFVKLPEYGGEGDYVYTSPEETEKALRELMGGAINENANVEISEEDAIVKGFKEGVTLMPHQIIGRAWMRDREDASKKRLGGILADDMGLGKTIQTLSRISEGRPKKSNQSEGWHPQNLVVAPLALVSQWAAEIEKMVSGLKVLEHQGTSRTSDPEVLQKFHIIVTTYDTVKSEYKAYYTDAKDEGKKGKGKKKAAANDSDSDSDVKRPTKRAAPKKSALFHLKYWRIVLDEAHNIKNHTSLGAQACCALEGKYRWCLTGTPMQNNVSELYSLFKFLKIKPLNDLETFNLQIAKPVKSGKGANRAMKRLQVVLEQVMLRRRKDQMLNGKVMIELPARNIEIVSCPFSPAELAFYQELELKMGNVLEDLMDSGKANSYVSVLVLLLRLRQACNHPRLVSEDYKADVDAVEPTAAKNNDDKDVDPDDLAAAFEQLGVTKKCQVCQSVLQPSNTSEDSPQHCSKCASLAKKAALLQLERPDSAKIRMVVKLLQDIKKRSDGKEKTIIFSQFTTMLDIIQPFVKEAGFDYVRYDGKMKRVEREASLTEIKTSDSTQVILISFKAGSTGLNLTACNNVILVDMWWNPALEEQAFDRAHRFGQTRDVNIYKLKIDDTVEDRILDLQEKKRELAKAALSGDKIKNMRLGIDDLLALFRPGARDDDSDDD